MTENNTTYGGLAADIAASTSKMTEYHDILAGITFALLDIAQAIRESTAAREEEGGSALINIAEAIRESTAARWPKY